MIEPSQLRYLLAKSTTQYKGNELVTEPTILKRLVKIRPV